PDRARDHRGHAQRRDDSPSHRQGHRTIGGRNRQRLETAAARGRARRARRKDWRSMSDKPTQSEHLLRLINDLGAEAAHTDAEPRVSAFHDRLRTASLVAMAASVVLFVIAFTVTHRAEVAAQRQLAESTA